MSKSLNEATSYIRKLKSQIGELNSEIDYLEHEISQKDKQIASLTSLLDQAKKNKV